MLIIVLISANKCLVVLGMDNYEVVRVAGRGAYGTAYLARRKTDGREVILKQVRAPHLA